MRRFGALAAAALALAVPAGGATRAQITVLAAASLADVLPKIDSRPRYSFAGSDQLAAQIQQGAPADIFAAASPKYPDDLYARGLVEKPVTFATNRLVLIVPSSNPAGIHSVFDLRRGGIKLVVGTPTVPIGSYTRQILRNLGLTGVLSNVVSQETDVRSILAKVALGEADAGFVYVTDARTVGTKIVQIKLPAWAQPKVRYELAIVKGTKNRAAALAFVSRVLGKRGQALLRSAGFGSVDQSGQR